MWLGLENFTPQQCRIYLSHQEGAKSMSTELLNPDAYMHHCCQIAQVYLSEFCDCCKFRSVQFVHMTDQFHVTPQRKAILEVVGNGVYFI